MKAEGPKVWRKEKDQETWKKIEKKENERRRIFRIKKELDTSREIESYVFWISCSVSDMSKDVS